MLKALAGSSWGPNKETLLMTYNALGKSIANNAAPVTRRGAEAQPKTTIHSLTTMVRTMPSIAGLQA